MASLSLKCDLTKAVKKFEKDASKFIHIGKIRCGDDNPFLLNFSGEICSAGIGANEFINGKKKTTTFSVGLEIEEGSAEVLIFSQIAELAKTEIKKIFLDEEWEYSNLIKDDNKVYIKLKTDSTNRAFSTKTNLSINPKKYSESNDYDILSFSGDVQVWFNLEDQKYGITLSPKKLDFLKNDE